MAYMNRITFEITADCPRDNTLDFYEIDDAIASSIRLLNLKGYRTAWCCSGHADIPQAYIQFYFAETYPWDITDLPSGWSAEENQMDYEYKSTSPQDLEQEIATVMTTLEQWGKALPDLTL